MRILLENGYGLVRQLAKDLRIRPGKGKFNGIRHGGAIGIFTDAQHHFRIIIVNKLRDLGGQFLNVFKILKVNNQLGIGSVGILRNNRHIKARHRSPGRQHNRSDAILLADKFFHFRANGFYALNAAALGYPKIDRKPAFIRGRKENLGDKQEKEHGKQKGKTGQRQRLLLILQKHIKNAAAFAVKFALTVGNGRNLRVGKIGLTIDRRLRKA